MSFWHDKWCGDVPLLDSFPDLYYVTRNKEGMVADYMSFSGGQLFWNPICVRDMQDWELEVLSSFMEWLYSVGVEGVGEDRVL